MRLPTLSLTLAASLLLGLAASAAGSPAKTSVNDGDSQFMRNAAADGLAEIQLGQLALKQSSSAPLKKTAQTLIDDHTQANAQLGTLAQTLQVKLPNTPSSQEEQQQKQLQALKGKAFDKGWTKAVIKDHHAAIKMFKKEGRHATDPQIKAFAKTTLPVLKKHLALAEQLQLPDARDQAMDSAIDTMRNNPIDEAPAAVPAAPATPAAQPATSSTPATH